MYVVYKGSGGLIHMLSGLVYCISWCTKRGWNLIIDVKGHECFQHNISDFFIIDNKFKRYSENYDNVDKNITFKRLSLQKVIDAKHIEIDRGMGNFTHFYKIENFNIRKSLDDYQKGEKLRVYAGPGCFSYFYIVELLKVKPEIMKMIKELNLIDGNYCGVHFRNTDRHNDINIFINKMRNNPYKKIYLATDDATAYDIILSALPTHTIIQYKNPINANGKPIHYMEDDKYNLVISLIVDMYYLTYGHGFIESPGSLVSGLVEYMRKNNKNIWTV